MSVGLLGFLSVQSQALQSTHRVYWYSRANLQIRELLEYLQISPPSMRESVVAHWRAQLMQALPEGQGEVLGRYPDYQITVTWKSISSRATGTCSAHKDCLRVNAYVP